MPIQFLNIKELNPEEAEKITEIAGHYHEKLKIKIKKEFLLKIHVKAQKKTGNRIKYSTHLRIESPNILAVTDAHDWDLTRTLHESFKKLEKEINHKFKLEGHLPKPK